MSRAKYRRDTTTTSTLGGLRPGTTYYVKVRVITASGGNVSPYSKAVKIKTLEKDPDVPPVPTPTPTPTPVPVPASVRLNLPAHPRVLLVGDSYTEGVGAVPITNGYAFTIAEPLGWTLTRDGRGGSGYANPTTYGAGVYADRLFQHPADGFDLVVLQGSSNDQRYTRDELDERLTTTLRVAREWYPHAQLLLVGPTSPYGNPGADLVRVDDQVRAAAAASGAAFIEPLAERWFVPRDGQWAANPANGHPSNEGHARIAERFVAGVRALS